MDWLFGYLPDPSRPSKPSARSYIRLAIPLSIKISSATIQRLNSAVNSDDFKEERITPLLKAVINNGTNDIIWDKAHAAVAAFTPPPLEHRKYMLKDELGSSLYIGLPRFYNAFFGDVEKLESVSQAVFAKFQEGEEPIFGYGRGWRGWPNEAKEPEVLK